MIAGGLADLFYQDIAHIAFTLNITEAINIALKGLLCQVTM